MPRSGAEARLRLQQAALDLYAERGYDATTAAEIAARAGVNERTFFRHFADKREVLFDFEAEARREWRGALAGAPDAEGPLALLMEACRATVPFLQANREASMRRQAVIAATPALRERQLTKAAHLVDDAVEGLRARGIKGPHAALAASIAITAFAQARQRWTDDPDSDLDALIIDTFADLAELTRATHRLGHVEAAPATV